MKIASQLGHDGIARAFVEYGISKGATAEAWNDCLRVAVQNRHIEVVKLLIEAKKGLLEKERQSMLMEKACELSETNPQDQNGLADLMSLFSKNSKIKSLPWTTAAANGTKAILCLLSDTGSAESSNFQAILFEAAGHGNLDTLEYLLEHGGIDINEWDCAGYTPLHLAARGGHWRVVEHLLGAGANAWSSNDDNKLPIESAAAGNHDDIVRTLASACPNKEYLWKTLRFAVASGKTSLVQILLEAVASPSATNQNLQTARLWADT